MLSLVVVQMESRYQRTLSTVQLKSRERSTICSINYWNWSEQL